MNDSIRIRWIMPGEDLRDAADVGVKCFAGSRDMQKPWNLTI